jgi:primosomal protein N' (replication factor Y)
MDHDTTKSKRSLEKIIYDFSRGKSDILVGTQMVTKGFDFDHLGLVGIVNADSLTRFPDFRAGERAFQQMTQVAGRAGRRGEQGLVILQAFTPDHPTIGETITNDYINFFKREMKERKEFYFPPFYKMIRIEFKHTKHDVLALGAKYFAEELQKEFKFRIKGPFIPSVARVKNKYIQFVNIKMEIDQDTIASIKEKIIDVRSKMKLIEGIKGVRVNIDVDPY